jgi:hypothetical protein
VAGPAAQVARASAPAAPTLLLVPLLVGLAGKWPAGGAISSGPPPLVTVIERRAAGLTAIPTNCGPPPSSAVSA